MSRNIRVSEPSAEMQIKIIRAKDAIASQRPRIVRCPYCRHNSIIVFEDTRGHVQTKCKACGRETVFNVLEMRRLRNFTAVENEVADNRFQRSELDYPIYNDPLAYADLILNSKLNVLFE